MSSRIWYKRCFHTTFWIGPHWSKSRNILGSWDQLLPSNRLFKPCTGLKANLSKKKSKVRAILWEPKIPTSEIGLFQKVWLITPSSVSELITYKLCSKAISSWWRFTSTIMRGTCSDATHVGRKIWTPSSWCLRTPKATRWRNIEVVSTVKYLFGINIAKSATPSLPVDQVASLTSLSLHLLGR